MSKTGDDVCARVTMTSIADWPDADVFFLVAFRCWLAGYETGDVACWELAWQGVSTTVPLADACARVTDDEHLALQVVACAQRGELPQAVELVRKLCANDDHVDLVNAACDLGAVLKQAELSLTNTGNIGVPEDRGRSLH